MFEIQKVGHEYIATIYFLNLKVGVNKRNHKKHEKLGIPKQFPTKVNNSFLNNYKNITTIFPLLQPQSLVMGLGLFVENPHLTVTQSDVANAVNASFILIAINIMMQGRHRAPKLSKTLLMFTTLGVWIPQQLNGNLFVHLFQTKGTKLQV